MTFNRQLDDILTSKQINILTDIEDDARQFPIIFVIGKYWKRRASSCFGRLYLAQRRRYKQVYASLDDFICECFCIRSKV